MGFKPDNARLSGVLPLTLPDDRVVNARIDITGLSDIVITFSDKSLSEIIMIEALKNRLHGMDLNYSTAKSQESSE